MPFEKPGLPIDGDNVELEFEPTNYTKDNAGTDAVDLYRLAAHLKGIDNALSGLVVGQRIWVDPGLTDIPANLYVDNTTGNDVTGDGSLANPWRTLGKAMLSTPILADEHRTITLAASASPYSFPSRTLWAFNLVTVKGALSVDASGLVATTNTGGTASTGVQVEVSGASWVVDEHVGKLIRFTSGALSGKYGVIYKNTSDMIYTTTQNTSFSAPSSGDTFDLYTHGTEIVWDVGTALTEETASVNRQLFFEDLSFNISASGSGRSLQISSVTRINFNRCYFDENISTVLTTNNSRSRFQTSYVGAYGSTFGGRGVLRASSNAGIEFFKGTVVDCRYATSLDSEQGGISVNPNGNIRWQGETVFRGLGTLGIALEGSTSGLHDNVGTMNVIRLIDCQTGFVVNSNDLEGGGFVGVPQLYGNVTGDYVLTATRGALCEIQGGTCTTAIGTLSVSADNGISNSSINSDGTRIAGGTPDPQSGFVPVLPMISGRYYDNSQYLTTGATFSTPKTSGTLYAVPFRVGYTTELDRIAVELTESVTGDVRLGVYSDSGGVPYSLKLDAGAVTNPSIGAVEISISVTLDPGNYWLCAAHDHGSNRRFRCFDNLEALGTLGYPDPLTTAKSLEYASAGFGAGALPSLFPAGAFVQTKSTRILVRKA